MGIIQNDANMSDYFRASANTETNQENSMSIAQKIQGKFSAVFTGIGYFEGPFKVWVREDSHPYQAPPMWLA